MISNIAPVVTVRSPYLMQATRTCRLLQRRWVRTSSYLSRGIVPCYRRHLDVVMPVPLQGLSRARLLSTSGRAKDSSVANAECGVKEATSGNSRTVTSIKKPDSIYDCFLDSVMPLGDMSVDVASMKSLTGQPCIINANEATMDHKYIDDARSLADNLSTINCVIERSANAREKPLVMIVLGLGGGKTRLLEECRRALNQDDSTLVIAITMNAHSSYYGASEMFVSGEENMQLNCALSVLLRVMCIVYNYSFKEAISMVNRNKDKLQLGNGLPFQNEALVDFIRAFMSRAICAIDSRFRSESKRPLERVVLMMDEVMRMSTQFEEARTDADSTMANKNNFSSFISAMETALLDQKLNANGGNVKASLIISSLEFPLWDRTSFDRIMISIYTPDLDPEEVVSRWFLRGVENAPGPGTPIFEQLKLIALTLSEVPRLLQFAQQFILLHRRDFDGSNPVLRPEVVRDLYAYVYVLFAGAYPRYGSGLPSLDEKRFALIHQTPTKLDETSASLIRSSYFSSHPWYFPLADAPPVVFVPKASIAMLAAYEARDDSFSTLRDKELFTNQTLMLNTGKFLFYNTFVSILNAINSKAVEGRALEETVESWLVARLVSARKAGRMSIPLFDLLGLHELFHITAPNVEISTPSLHGYVPDESPLPPISEDADKYADLFNERVKVSKSNPCVLYKSAAQQSYDTMLVSEIGEAVHVLFIDMNSKSIEHEITYALDVHQYDKIERVRDALKAKVPSQLSKVSRALIAGNYTYVYMTTRPSVQLYRGTEILREVPSNLIFMTEANSKAFMGILYNFYVSARSLLYSE